MDNSDNLKTEGGKPRYFLLLNIILIIGVISVISFYLFSSPVRSKDVTIHISSSDSFSKISKELENKKVIRHSFLLKSFIYIFSNDKQIKKGDYLFKRDISFVRVFLQLAKGEHGVDPIRITIKEGATNEDIARLLADKMPTFHKDLFLSDEKSKQGYLFPDTYFFFPLSTTDEILNDISVNFQRKIKSLDEDIKSSGKPLEDILIMASILEKEARGVSDSPIISGILWKRIRLGMPLQVDVAPITYKKADLPDNPISNPGLVSIQSAINPVESTYLFYLHDKDGQVHYAKDFSLHRSNIARYLK